MRNTAIVKALAFIRPCYVEKQGYVEQQARLAYAIKAERDAQSS